MAAAFVIVVAGIKSAGSILNPLLLAIFLSVISAPAYFKLRSRGFSEWLALLAVIAVLSVVMFRVLFFVTQSIASFTQQQQHYQDRLKEEKAKVISIVKSWIPDWGKPDKEESSVPQSDSGESTEPDPASEGSDPSETQTPEPGAVSEESPLAANTDQLPPEPDSPLVRERQTLMDYLMDQFDPGTAISLAGTVANSLGQLLSNAFLILLTVIFILLEASTFTRKVSDAFVRTEEANERAQQIVNSVQHYIIIKTWVSLATGILIGVWLNLWGVSHAPLWGLLAFLFNYIPNVGSILAAIPAVLVAWLELTWLPAMACAVGFVVVNGAIGNFIEPRMMGKSLGLSPLVVFFSMIFWGWVLGPVGMLLSVPLTMTARIAMDGFEDTRWIATFMGNAS